MNPVYNSLILPYREGTTWIHRLDPRTKTLGFLLLALTAVLSDVRRWPTMTGILLSLLLIASSARIPLKTLLLRVSVVLPFSLMVLCTLPWMAEGPSGRASLGPWLISRHGLYILASITVKSALAVLAVSLLSMTTPFSAILAGLGRLRVPRVLVVLLSFMYRYLFVLIEETHRMMIARDARMAGPLSLKQQAHVTGAMAATLFLRTYERAERIAQAMLARGFDGEIRTLNLLRCSSADARFIALLLTVVALLLLWSQQVPVGPMP